MRRLAVAAAGSFFVKPPGYSYTLRLPPFVAFVLLLVPERAVDGVSKPSSSTVSLPVMTWCSMAQEVTTFCCRHTASAPTLTVAAPGQVLYAEVSSARTSVCLPSSCSKKYEMPALSRRRETKAKWVSLYCTQ